MLKLPVFDPDISPDDVAVFIDECIGWQYDDASGFMEDRIPLCSIHYIVVVGDVGFFYWRVEKCFRCGTVSGAPFVGLMTACRSKKCREDQYDAIFHGERLRG